MALRFHRAWYSVIALIPFCVSLCFTSAPQAAAVSGERESGGLVFDRYMVNLGHRPIAYRPVLEVPFRYRNVTDQPVRIQSLTPSCGCLRPAIDTMEIAPGATGQLMMPVRLANEAPGPHEYLVKVLYDDTRPREVDLALKVVLPEKEIVVQPRAMWFYQSGSQTTTQTVTITDHRDTDFEVLNMQCSSKLWSVKQISDRRALSGERKLKLEVTLHPGVPPGKHRGLIVLNTSDVRYPQIQIPLGCQNTQTVTEGLTVLAEPETLVLQPTPAGQVSASTVLTGSDGRPAVVRSVRVLPDSIRAEVRTNEKHETVLQLSGTVPASGSTGNTKAVVTVETENTESPLTIPVVIRQTK